jgi:hypothetical protein
MIKTELEHKCSLCSKNYSSKYNLNKHEKKCKLKIKSDDELKCEFCQKIYSHNLTLQNHYKKCLYKKLKDFELKNQNLITDINNLRNENFILKQEKLKLEIEIKIRSEISTVNTTITNNYTSKDNEW